ncbi:MAG: hypothetical protein ACFB5Z_00860 [Elainellaceae cyanobacterium]
MHLLTLAFDLTAVGGGLYLVIGLVLHLIAAWKSCAPTSALSEAAVLPVRNEQPSPRRQSELEQLAAWNDRFGLT